MSHLGLNGSQLTRTKIVSRLGERALLIINYSIRCACVLFSLKEFEYDLNGKELSAQETLQVKIKDYEKITANR